MEFSRVYNVKSTNSIFFQDLFMETFQPAISNLQNILEQKIHGKETRSAPARTGRRMGLLWFCTRNSIL